MKNRSDEIMFEIMRVSDHAYLYRLGESTMRPYVEEVWGSWDETGLWKFYGAKLDRGEFHAIVETKIGRVGAISVLESEAYYQLEGREL